jgi:hypothetical protein
VDLVDVEVAADLHTGDGDVGAVEIRDRAEHEEPEDQHITNGQAGAVRGLLDFTHDPNPSL